MKLKAIDQVHVSAVKADSLQPGEVFEVSAAAGRALLAKRPGIFELVEDEVEEKAEPARDNKALAAAPANKAAKKGK
ncbi:MAG: hypothetical protein EON59_16245 [Alphaproteobacteria bacterium]|nr:MAG: hypothetical protein EON59_16245 [Alphaproteobacteria bacterium]